MLKILNKTRIVFNSYDFEQRVDPRMEKALYRICQEAIHNIIKHSDADSATIELFREFKQIALVIEDNGKGFDIKNVDLKVGKSGIGLISMRERVYVFNGDFNIESKMGEGTEIVVVIPCLQQQESNGEN